MLNAVLRPRITVRRHRRHPFNLRASGGFARWRQESFEGLRERLQKCPKILREPFPFGSRRFSQFTSKVGCYPVETTMVIVLADLFGTEPARLPFVDWRRLATAFTQSPQFDEADYLMRARAGQVPSFIHVSCKGSVRQQIQFLLMNFEQRFVSLRIE